MKKALSLLMAFLMLFSSLCVGANAGDAVPEQAYGKVETQDGRIFLTDDELKEKFGIEKILLSEEFEPIEYIYYNGGSGCKFPEYLTVVFDDGTTVEIKAKGRVYDYKGDIEITVTGYNFSSSVFYIYVYVIPGYVNVFKIDCEKEEEASFAENTKHLLDVISNYSLEFFSVFFGPRLDNDFIPYITGIDIIDYPIYRILIVFYLIQIIISENAAFVSYYFKELFSNT